MFQLGTTVVYMKTLTPSNQQVAQVVKDAIVAANTSQRALAEKSGIPLTTLSRRLTGTSAFVMTELNAIAVALGLRPSELMQRAELLAVSDSAA